MDTALLLLLAFGIFIGFYVQTVVGFAGSLVALPILLFGLEFQDAVAYISIFYVFSSISLLAREWPNMEKKILLQLAITSVIGVVVGIVVLTFAKPVLLKKGLGIFILLYIAHSILGKRKVILNRSGVFGMGLLAGFFAGLFSTGGPLYVICVENTVKNVKALRATMIGVLGLVTMTRVPALAVSGILGVTHLKHTLFVLPAFILAQYLGRLTFQHMNEAMFRKTLLFLLCASAVALIL